MFEASFVEKKILEADCGLQNLEILAGQYTSPGSSSSSSSSSS